MQGQVAVSSPWQLSPGWTSTGDTRRTDPRLAMPFPTVMLTPIIASALMLLPASSICMPRPSRANESFRLSQRSDSDSGSIMVIVFSAIVLVALIYALAIGWERTKEEANAQTGQTHPLSDDESPPEMVQAAERLYTPTAERSLCAE
jgi:hypothetical protein